MSRSPLGNKFSSEKTHKYVIYLKDNIGMYLKSAQNNLKLKNCQITKDKKKKKWIKILKYHLQLLFFLWMIYYKYHKFV